eukprot:Amastigsp_a174484_4.p4 type:complete len:172 gc:universal Amastigsp_a174484_4:808-293(-)
MAIASMLRQYMATHAEPSDCSSTPPVGSGLERSKTPMLSSPRNPPSKTFFPARSLRLIHQVKLSSRRENTVPRNTVSYTPVTRCVSWYTRRAAHACTGGLQSLKFHSYAGICPLGCMYQSRSSSTSCRLAHSGSISASGTQWNARSHAANHGYSNLSGMLITSLAYMCIQS